MGNDNGKGSSVEGINPIVDSLQKGEESSNEGMLGLLKRKKTRKRRKKGIKLKGFGFIKSKKFLAGLLIFIILFGVGGYFFVYQPYVRIRAQGEKVLQAGREAKDAFKENDIDLVESKFENVEKEFSAFEKEAESVYWMKYVPVAGWYVADFEHGVIAGESLISAGKKAITAIKPHADLIGFKKGEDSGFTDKPAEERLQTAVLTLDKIVDEVDDIAEDVDRARDSIAEIDENHYPESIGGTEIRSTVKNYKDQFSGIASLFVDAKPFIKALPDILGAEEDQTYLVLFLNDNELRATGGFITAYAVFNVNQGKFSVERSDDIYTLDASIPNHPAAPEKIKEYHKNVSKFYIRDSNLSPDFVESAKLFDDLYKDSRQRVDYDGIISVDTDVLVDVLEILGPTQARGFTFSSEMDDRCDCPQVIYTLLDEIDRPVAYLKDDRKGILGDLLLALMQKSLGVSPSQYWGRLSQSFIKNMQEKHIIMYMKDDDIQKSLEALNFAGRIQEFDGDYLHISDVNFAGAKSNLYVQHEVTSNTIIESDGTVKRELTLEYRNPEPHSNCNLEDGGGLGRGGLCINATLRNWMRIYVPEGSELVELKGSETKVQTYDDLGKTVFEGFFGVKPEGKSTVTVTYTLPFKVESKEDYNLLIQKQPGTVGHDYTILLDGKQLDKTELIMDTKFGL